MVKWTRGHSAAAGRSHTGPLGLHLVALAPSSPAPTAGLGLKERKQALEKRWSSEAGSKQQPNPDQFRRGMESPWQIWICMVLMGELVREAQRDREAESTSANRKKAWMSH